MATKKNKPSKKATKKTAKKPSKKARKKLTIAELEAKIKKLEEEGNNLDKVIDDLREDQDKKEIEHVSELRRETNRVEGEWLSVVSRILEVNQNRLDSEY